MIVKLYKPDYTTEYIDLNYMGLSLTYGNLYADFNSKKVYNSLSFDPNPQQTDSLANSLYKSVLPNLINKHPSLEDAVKDANKLVFDSLFKDEYDKCKELQCISYNDCLELSKSNNAKFFYEDNDNIMIDMKNLSSYKHFIVKKIGMIDYNSLLGKTNINNTSPGLYTSPVYPSDYMTDIINNKIGFTKYVVVSFNDNSNY